MENQSQLSQSGQWSLPMTPGRPTLQYDKVFSLREGHQKFTFTEKFLLSANGAPRSTVLQLLHIKKDGLSKKLPLKLLPGKLIGKDSPSVVSWPEEQSLPQPHKLCCLFALVQFRICQQFEPSPCCWASAIL